MPKGMLEIIIIPNVQVNFFHLLYICFMNHIAKTIRYYRLEKKLTQKQLAALAGVSHKNVISAIERGSISPSTTKLLHKICDALELEIKILIAPKEIS
jgi:transcriptional regulator with XRE-family HTH domain